jgi:uncharacterized protein YbaR (Trm112 family)/protein-L-isoaspartate O-methyltransferase
VKRRLIEFLACPDCYGDLELEKQQGDRSQIREGELRCQTCRRLFPIRHGVPRLLPASVDQRTIEVSASFSWEWNQFDEMRPHYHQQFLDWIRPLEPDDFVDKQVLEGGCGKGRHSALLAGYGARDVFALDLGSAVEAAHRNTSHLRAVHVIQGDILRPPLKPCADIALSIGVLHHMLDPASGFRALADRVKPGGRIAVWVYSREGNQWIVDYVDPVRTHVTSRLPRRMLYEAARPLAYAVAGLSKGLYGPLARTGLQERFFYNQYLTYIARFPVREIHSIVFDHLVTPVAHYLSKEEIESWFGDARLTNVTIAHHNQNSWRAQGQLVAAEQTAASALGSKRRT